MVDSVNTDCVHPIFCLNIDTDDITYIPKGFKILLYK